MTETPECPYCGEEMELHHIPDGLWWYQCGCCGAIAPSDETPAQVLTAALRRAKPCASCQQLSKALCGKESTTLKELLNAVEQIKRRAEPENRVLTLEELKKHCKKQDAEPIWMECRAKLGISRWMLANAPDDVMDSPLMSTWIEKERIAADYLRRWRCWLRKPTPEQMAAEKWEE